MKILTINAGSSSVRLEAFAISDGEPRSLGQAAALIDAQVQAALAEASAGAAASARKPRLGWRIAVRSWVQNCARLWRPAPPVLHTCRTSPPIMPCRGNCRHGTASADMAAPSNLHPTHTAGK